LACGIVSGHNSANGVRQFASPLVIGRRYMNGRSFGSG
jgi:hypothetical protein